MPSLPNPIDLPGKLVSSVAEEIRNLSGTIGDLRRGVGETLEVGRDLVGIATKGLKQLERLEERADRIVDLGERLEAKADDVLEMGGRIEAEAREVNRHAAEVVAAMPTFTQAVGLVQPLEGTVDRLGRLMDRLPGGRPRTPPSGPATPD